MNMKMIVCPNHIIKAGWLYFFMEASKPLLVFQKKKLREETLLFKVFLPHLIYIIKVQCLIKSYIIIF